MNARLTPAAATNPELEAFWMPFTANRHFKANPRLLARALGMYYWTADGREVLDGVAGLWCVNAGHGRREITEAVTRQLGTMEFAPAFQMGHPIAFELANRLAITEAAKKAPATASTMKTAAPAKMYFVRVLTGYVIVATRDCFVYGKISARAM